MVYADWLALDSMWVAPTGPLERANLSHLSTFDIERAVM
jgi:hypothetical protein